MQPFPEKILAVSRRLMNTFLAVSENFPAAAGGYRERAVSGPLLSYTPSRMWMRLLAYTFSIKLAQNSFHVSTPAVYVMFLHLIALLAIRIPCDTDRPRSGPGGRDGRFFPRRSVQAPSGVSSKSGLGRAAGRHALYKAGNGCRSRRSNSAWTGLVGPGKACNLAYCPPCPKSPSLLEFAALFYPRIFHPRFA